MSRVSEIEIQADATDTPEFDAQPTDRASSKEKNAPPKLDPQPADNASAEEPTLQVDGEQEQATRKETAPEAIPQQTEWEISVNNVAPQIDGV